MGEFLPEPGALEVPVEDELKRPGRKEDEKIRSRTGRARECL